MMLAGMKRRKSKLRCQVHCQYHRILLRLRIEELHKNRNEVGRTCSGVHEEGVCLNVIFPCYKPVVQRHR